MINITVQLSYNKMDQLYDDEFLINRILEKLKDLDVKKFKMSKPEIERKNRGTFVSNFGILCNDLNRDHEMIRYFFEKEFGKKQEDVTISDSMILYIRGSYTDLEIANVIRNFANKYVLCLESKCKSGNTELIKEDRIKYMKCKTCGCKIALDDKKGII